MKLSRMLILTLLALVVIAAGCGGGGNKTSSTPTTSTQPPASAAKSTTVKLSEYAFDPSDVVIKKGGTISAKNTGTIGHNLTIEQGPDPKKPSKKLAGTSTFLPGNTESLKVSLKPGKYAMVCTVTGHRQLGMVGTLTVK